MQVQGWAGRKQARSAPLWLREERGVARPGSAVPRHGIAVPPAACAARSRHVRDNAQRLTWYVKATAQRVNGLLYLLTRCLLVSRTQRTMHKLCALLHPVWQAHPLTLSSFLPPTLSAGQHAWIPTMLHFSGNLLHHPPSCCLPPCLMGSLSGVGQGRQTFHGLQGALLTWLAMAATGGRWAGCTAAWGGHGAGRCTPSPSLPPAPTPCLPPSQTNRGCPATCLCLSSPLPSVLLQYASTII